MTVKEKSEQTLVQRAVSATVAPTHIGKGAQAAGFVLVLLVAWQGILPGVHKLLHPSEEGLEAPNLWLMALFLAAAIVLLAGAETLAGFVRALGSIIPGVGKKEE